MCGVPVYTREELEDPTVAPRIAGLVADDEAGTNPQPPSVQSGARLTVLDSQAGVSA
jgi:hypothetical protein